MKAVDYFIAISLHWIFLVQPFVPSTNANTVAVNPDDHCTNLICSAVGLVNGGIGFSFVPTKNVVVSEVGFMPEGNDSPIISFWKGTNVITTYVMDPTDTFDVVYNSISPLYLSAGEQYSITLQNGPLSGSNATIIIGWENYYLAPEMSNYSGPELLTYDGTLVSLGWGLILGPDFSYIVPYGDLSIDMVATNIWVTFSTSTNNYYDVQRSDDLASWTWSAIASNIAGAGGYMTTIDVGARQLPKMYYRVRVHSDTSN